MVLNMLRRATVGAHGTPGTVTVGVLIVVPEPGAGRLARVRADAGDPHAELIPPHVTLLPPTTRPVHQMREIERHLRRIGERHPPFAIRVHGTGTFRPITPVVFARVTDGVEGCAALETSIRTGVLHRPLAYDYHPHITLAAALADETLDRVQARMADCDHTFLVRDFLLMCFESDGRSRVEATIPLDGC